MARDGNQNKYTPYADLSFSLSKTLAESVKCKPIIALTRQSVSLPSFLLGNRDWLGFIQRPGHLRFCRRVPGSPQAASQSRVPHRRPTMLGPVSRLESQGRDCRAGTESIALAAPQANSERPSAGYWSDRGIAD